MFRSFETIWYIICIKNNYGNPQTYSIEFGRQKTGGRRRESQKSKVRSKKKDLKTKILKILKRRRYE
jgi:hypothetical protein